MSFGVNRLFVSTSSVKLTNVVPRQRSFCVHQLFISMSSRETFRSYSVDRLELLEVLTRKDPRSVNDPDRVLAEHFAEGLQDRISRRQIKQRLRQRPDIPFIDLREEAIRWSE